MRFQTLTIVLRALLRRRDPKSQPEPSHEPESGSAPTTETDPVEEDSSGLQDSKSNPEPKPEPEPKLEPEPVQEWSPVVGRPAYDSFQYNFGPGREKAAGEYLKILRTLVPED